MISRQHCPALLPAYDQRPTWTGSRGQAVWSGSLGTPIEPRNFHREFKTRCRKAGVREISVHTTRRTCATLLVALDVHPRVMMRILRHSQIAVTMNIYAQVASVATETALTRLGEQFL
jgi:integrase